MQMIKYIDAQVLPAAKREMLLALEGGGSIAQQRDMEIAAIPTPIMDIDLLTIFLAGVLQHPVQKNSVSLQEQVGRFVLLAYTPIQATDPEIVLCIAKNAVKFNAAMVKFVEVRVAPVYNWKQWYAKATATARELIVPLHDLHAHPFEADFVLRWALLKCATGERA